MREIPDAAPDETQAPERRVIALVQVGVGLRAELLKLLGVREQVPGSSQLLVFTSPQGRVLELADLESEQVEPRGFLALVHLQVLELVSETRDRFDTPRPHPLETGEPGDVVE